MERNGFYCYVLNILAESISISEGLVLAGLREASMSFGFSCHLLSVPPLLPLLAVS